MKRKTAAEKALDGNPGKRSLKPKARPDSGRIANPQTLEPCGQQEWKRLSEALEQSGKLTPSDEGLLFTAALCYQRVREAESIIAQQGLIVSGDRGVLVKNPACQLARDYIVQYHNSLKLLGLGAASRPDVAPPDALADPHGMLD